MVARQVQRICPHRVMRGSRDGGAQGCSLHRMRGCCGATYLLGQAFQAMGWGGLSRWESYNDRAIARVGDREGQEAQGRSLRRMRVSDEKLAVSFLKFTLSSFLV